MPRAEVTMFPEASTTNTASATTMPFHTVGADWVERTRRRRLGGRDDDGDGGSGRVWVGIGSDQNWK
jgi:hypothetical protein